VTASAATELAVFPSCIDHGYKFTDAGGFSGYTWASSIKQHIISAGVDSGVNTANILDSTWSVIVFDPDTTSITTYPIMWVFQGNAWFDGANNSTVPYMTYSSTQTGVSLTKHNVVNKSNYSFQLPANGSIAQATVNRIISPSTQDISIGSVRCVTASPGVINTSSVGYELARVWPDYGGDDFAALPTTTSSGGTTGGSGGAAGLTSTELESWSVRWFSLGLAVYVSWLSIRVFRWKNNV